MSIDESDVRKIVAEVQATSWRLRQCIRVRELAATHRLGQMRRLRMLEEQKAWKREAGFDHIHTAAGMDAQRFSTSLVQEPFYSKMFNPKWLHTPDEFTLELRVDVEPLRMEIVLLQPEPPLQCDPSPRRLPTVDKGSEEPQTPRRSPAIGTGLGEPGVSRAETQSTKRGEIVSLQASVDGFLRFHCTSPDQVDTITLLQSDVGVDDDKDQPTTSQQAAAREEFARPTKKWQPSKASTLIPEVNSETVTFLLRGMSCRVCWLLIFLELSLLVFFLPCSKSRYERQG